MNIAEPINKVLELGAYRANVIKAEDIVTDRVFRDICASNSCGMFGRCWTCPPDIGDIDKLMQDIHNYQYALVYQFVAPIEDSYDFEGMMDAAASHNQLVMKIRDFVTLDSFGTELDGILHLGAGGCHVCEICAKKNKTRLLSIRNLVVFLLNCFFILLHQPIQGQS